MSNDTPRTDALHTISCIASALITGPAEYSKTELTGFANELASSRIQLELELAALRERLAEAEREADQYRRTLRTMDDTGAPRGWSDIVAAAQDRAVKAEQRAERAEALAEQNAKDAGLFDYLQNIPAVEAQQYFWNYSSRKERAKAIAADKAERDAARKP